MMRMQNFVTVLLALSGLLVAGTAQADIFRCSDADGKTLYTNFPCPGGTRTINTLPSPQACTSAECDQRRERELVEARERARAEKDELAALAKAHRQREMDEQRLDEARYEAASGDAESVQGVAEGVGYPVYAIGGYPARCGTHCFNTAGHRRLPIGAHGPGNHDDHHGKGNGARPGKQPAGNERRLASNVVTPHRAVDR
ncbi:MAG: DUF4124 domain-containing protein [Betaproteobacteria bacterium]